MHVQRLQYITSSGGKIVAAIPFHDYILVFTEFGEVLKLTLEEWER